MLHEDVGDNRVSITWGVAQMLRNHTMEYCSTVQTLNPDHMDQHRGTSLTVWKETH